MTACRNECLRTTKGLLPLTLFFGNGAVKSWQIYRLFFLDVLGEIVHKGLQCWDKICRSCFQVLELLELLFDLIEMLQPNPR